MGGLRKHDVVLVDGDVRVRPFSEEDWRVIAPWATDPRVLRFSDFVEHRTMAEIQGIYRGVSRTAELFVIERGGVPVGDGWLQEMNLARITSAFPGKRMSRIDLQLAYEAWGQAVGSRAIRLLTSHAFERGDDLVFAVDVADFNERSRRAFLRSGFVPWRRVSQPHRGPGAWGYDLVCRPSYFYGTAPVEQKPGADRVRAGDPPHGAAIVVYRQAPDLQLLVLHHSDQGPEDKGDWAWTPPGGTRFPAEPIAECATRELYEETGLELALVPVGDDAAGWWLYLAEAPPDAPITLDHESDRYEWLPVAAALERCRPAAVAEDIALALTHLR
jgi:RimJ/RimL family protein N-acetyltransferase/8-oxo-dGTP pyrophosphatase MutT (NUDIX family)